MGFTVCQFLLRRRAPPGSAGDHPYVGTFGAPGPHGHTVPGIDIGEQHAAHAGVVTVAAAHGHGTGGIHSAAVQKALGHYRIDFDDLFSQQAMRFAMHGVGGFGGWRFEQAEQLAAAFVPPVITGLRIPNIRFSTNGEGDVTLRIGHPDIEIGFRR